MMMLFDLKAKRDEHPASSRTFSFPFSDLSVSGLFFWRLLRSSFSCMNRRAASSYSEWIKKGKILVSGKQSARYRIEQENKQKGPFVLISFCLHWKEKREGKEGKTFWLISGPFSSFFLANLRPIHEPMAERRSHSIPAAAQTYLAPSTRCPDLPFWKAYYWFI